MTRLHLPLPSPARRFAGRVILVDPPNRLLRVWDGAAARDVLVPPGCEVRLNDEPIRLRLLEAGDPVEVEAIASDAELTAVAVRGGVKGETRDTRHETREDDPA